MRNLKNKPVYKKLIETVQAGFSALDDKTQQEIIRFTESQQHSNGAFADRAANPDLYYSLFGTWLCMATQHSAALGKLKGFLTSGSAKSPGLIDDLALILLKTELEVEDKKQSVFKIFRTIFKKGRTIGLSYRFFLLSLVIDAIGKEKRFFYLVARTWLFFYRPKGNIPCSLESALIFARKMVGADTSKEGDRLSAYFVESGGFRAFGTVETADTLSTGVALFVLNEIGYDLRLIKPRCLAFIEENFTDGAFLSGDGDETKDLEYTFYGLLALGSLLKNEKDP